MILDCLSFHTKMSIFPELEPGSITPKHTRRCYLFHWSLRNVSVLLPNRVTRKRYSKHWILRFLSAQQKFFRDGSAVRLFSRVKNQNSKATSGGAWWCYQNDVCYTGCHRNTTHAWRPGEVNIASSFKKISIGLFVQFLEPVFRNLPGLEKTPSLPASCQISARMCWSYFRSISVRNFRTVMCSNICNHGKLDW